MEFCEARVLVRAVARIKADRVFTTSELDLPPVFGYSPNAEQCL